MAGLAEAVTLNDEQGSLSMSDAMSDMTPDDALSDHPVSDDSMPDGIESSIEQALLKKAQQGDREAFEQLHLRLEPPIRRFIRRLIGHEQDCDDLVQETFLSLYLNLHRINPLSQLRAYTYQIARNACYSRLRRLRRRDELSIEEDEEAPGGPRLSFDLRDTLNAAPEDVAHWMLLKMEVDEAIDRLPASQREVLLLYSEAELSYAEIAQTLDISLGTVKSRIFHAKRTLRGLVKPHVLLAIQADHAAGDQAQQDAVQRLTDQGNPADQPTNRLEEGSQKMQPYNARNRVIGEL